MQDNNYCRLVAVAVFSENDEELGRTELKLGIMLPNGLDSCSNVEIIDIPIARAGFVTKVAFVDDGENYRLMTPFNTLRDEGKYVKGTRVGIKDVLRLEPGKLCAFGNGKGSGGYIFD